MSASASLSINSTVEVGERTFIIERKLGRGAFGVVYKVRDPSSIVNGVYALKDVLCLHQSAIGNVLREIQTMRQISHENVIAMVDEDKFRDKQGLHVLILTEYCAGGNLNERLTRRSSEELNYKWICQTSAALSFLHSRNVVHRDLKPDNVLLTSTEDAKLADFGLAREFIALKQPNVHDDDYWMTTYLKYYMNSAVGTPYWMAPEVFSNHGYTEKADVFSIGALFYAILERDYIDIDGKPYYGAFKSIPGKTKVGLGCAMEENPHTRIPFSLLAQGSTALQRITLDAMQYNKDDRPSAAEIHDQVMSTGQNIKLHGSDRQQSSCQSSGCRG